MKKIKLKYLLAPIFVIIIATIVILTVIFSKPKSDDSRWNIKEVYLDKNSIKGEVAIIPKWDEMTITQKFSFTIFEGNTYDTLSAKVEENLVEKHLGTAVLNGRDVYTNTEHTINANVYKLKDIPQKCAIVLQYENDTEYYTFVNMYYRPVTLEEFMNDLNLKDNVSFGSIWYDYSYWDENEQYHYELIEFPDVPDDIIWEMLFNDRTVENVHKDLDSYIDVMGASVDMPLFGYKNISVGVTEDGFLTTNIFSTGKTFYIGKEKVQNFIDYILDNYEGYKTVYVDENGNEINEFEEEQEENETIMVYTNNTAEEHEVNVTSSGKNFTEPYDPFAE